MANIKSQKKRIVTNEKRRVQSRGVRTALKTYVRKFHEALEGGDREAAARALRTAGRELDRAASKGIIHANSAANRKSAMARQLNAASR